MKTAGDSAWELLGEREKLRRLRGMFVWSPTFSALLRGPEHRFVLVNPAYQALIGYRNVTGLTVREAIPEAVPQGFIALLDNVFLSGDTFIGRNVEMIIHRSHSGPAETRLLDFVYEPIRNEAGYVTSIFVEGVDITDQNTRREAQPNTAEGCGCSPRRGFPAPAGAIPLQ